MKLHQEPIQLWYHCWSLMWMTMLLDCKSTWVFKEKLCFATSLHKWMSRGFTIYKQAYTSWKKNISIVNRYINRKNHTLYPNTSLINISLHKQISHFVRQHHPPNRRLLIIIYMKVYRVMVWLSTTIIHGQNWVWNSFQWVTCFGYYYSVLPRN